MRSLVDSACMHPRVWLAGLGLITAALGAALPRLELRTDGAAIHPRDSGAVRASAADQIQFHDEDRVLVLIKSRAPGPAVDSPAGFAFLRAVHDSLAL